MVKFNCIIREDNVGKTISEDGMLDAVDIEETLQSKYIYLYDSIKQTNYQLKVNHCTYFKEIVFHKKVVGFFAYTIINSVSNLSMVASYILPEFRGRGLFFDEINSVFEEGKEISIYQPPRFVMELLLKYGFAKKISDNLVVSSINIDLPSNSISNIFGSDEIMYEDFMYSSNIYDLDLCGFLVIPGENEEIVYLTDAFKEDVEKYDVTNKRESIGDEYFKGVLKNIKNNENQIHKFLSSIQKNYSVNTNIESAKTINFEELKSGRTDKLEDNIVESFEKIENTKNTLLESHDLIDKEKYIKAYQNVGIYDFIRIFDDNNNLELTNSIIKIDHEFKADYLRNLVIKEEYITNKIDSDELEEYLSNLKVNELKSILKDNDLTVTGNKTELISRIMKYVPSNNVLDKGYYISEKGYEFIANHEEIDFYNLFLKDFYYYEFRNFLQEHDDNLNKVATLFLNEHLKNSVLKRDNKGYTDSLNALAFINELNNNLDKGLFYELKKFIVGLNPIFLDESSYNYYQPISKNNIDNINLLLLKSKLNLEEEFEKIWQNMEIKDFLVPYKKSFSILKKMLAGDDRDYMNDKIREKYLRKETVIHDKLDKSVQSTLDKYLKF